jgi:outer membrane translocation and assembly module TamA
LNYFGIGNDSLEADRSNFALLDRRAGATGYYRPVGWLALGGRSEGFWPRTDSGENPDSPSIEVRFNPSHRPGYAESTNYFYVGGSVNINYPYVRSERPRRGGDYVVSVGAFRDVSGTRHSFTRVEVEGLERFTVAGRDRGLTIHGRLSSSTSGSGETVPFYLMDTLGGADNLRGFKEAIIGADEATSTLRSFESFQFRDLATALMQVDFRQRLWSQVWVSVFADGGVVAPSLSRLSFDDPHRGIGVGLSIYRANALAIRVEFALWGGDGHPHYVTTGRGINF